MEHQDRADELEREADRAAQPSEQLGDEIEQVRSDWEAKQSDQGVAGAVDDQGAGPHQLEGEDPASGERKQEERQAELEDAARVQAEDERDE